MNYVNIYAGKGFDFHIDVFIFLSSLHTDMCAVHHNNHAYAPSRLRPMKQVYIVGDKKNKTRKYYKITW